MDGTNKGTESEALPTGVFELPGEPAIVINGVPEVPASDGSNMDVSGTVTDAESGGNASLETEFLGNGGFGEWLEGREVRKLFGEQYYTGTVTQFDKENGWYRVVYEDYDFEDLDWRELEEVLLPLDISVPLKSLALKIVKKNQKNVHKAEKSLVGSQIGRLGSTGSKGTED